MNIKMVANTTGRIPPHTLDDEYPADSTTVSIVEDEGRYGIITEKDEILLPLEYDNITVIGFGIYLLIKSGKWDLLTSKNRICSPTRPLP